MPAARTSKQKVARRLRAQGKSLNQIARQINVAKSNVSFWVRNTRLTKTAKQKLAERVRKGSAKGRLIVQRRWTEYRLQHPKPPRNLNRLHINEFFDNWTPESAYVLGFFAADGCMYHSRNGGHSTGGLYVTFCSADRQLMETVKDAMRIKNKIETEDRSSENHQQKHHLRIVNQRAYRRLLELGFVPSKSLKLRFPQVPTYVLAHFVRGYFDGDGCVYYSTSRSGKKILMTSFTSGSKQFLEILRARLMLPLGRQSGALIQRAKHHFVLQYSKNDSRQLYQFMYPTPTVPCLQRKRAIFERAIKELAT